MAHYIDYNQTDGSTPVATLSRVGSVKPDGTSINISADGTINCNGKADRDAGNLTAEGIANIIRYGMPDYSAMIRFDSSPYEAPSNGWIIIVEGYRSNIKVNDIVIASSGSYNFYAQIPVKKGDIISGQAPFFFCPLYSGVN